MNIKFSSKANRSLSEIYDYFAVDKEVPEVDKRIIAQILRAIERLSDNPYLGKALSYFPVAEKYDKYRFIVSKKYIIIYLFDNDAIRIYDIYHSSQNYISAFME